MRRITAIFASIPLAACTAATDTPDASTGTTDAGVTLVEEACSITDPDVVPDDLERIPCLADFLALASTPIDATLPGARSVKVLLDTADANHLYFQNSTRFQVHYAFASTHLSGNGLPIVASISEFNATEYFSPERRFLLGAVTYYEGPGTFALELSPYDTASAAMMETLFRAVAAHAYFGPALLFHPTSEAVTAEAAHLPADVPTISTDTLYGAIAYQPLTLGTAIGRVHFTTAAALETEYLPHEDIVVLDQAPNDISVVQGLITEEFQTPLSHVNVLSRNRGTPNMGLRHATTNATLRAYDGQLAKLTVTAQAWMIEPATQEEALAFWAAHRPDAVTLPALDLSIREIKPIAEVTAEPSDGVSMRDAIKTAVDGFGGKAAHYSVLARTEGVPTKKAFAVPVWFYDRFLRDNGFLDRVNGMLADASFTTDAAVRAAALAQLQEDMMSGTIDADLQDALRTLAANEFPGRKLRFRTSTNSEDLDGFPCAGCYESHTGDPADWEDVLDAIRETYASAWSFRTFEERTYYGVAHDSVGMALLLHANFPDEEANGVAVTSNPYDPAGLDPAFYVNVQHGGDAEVVAPPPGVTSDSFLLFFSRPNQPVSYLTHSNLIPSGDTVLTSTQVHALGTALQAIHARFSPAYGPASGNTGWYAMDVEFKFDDEADPGAPATLYVKQARPYPRN